MKERIPFEAYENSQWKPKQKRMCAFYNRLGIDPDPNPCEGVNTDHHVHYRAEGGTDERENLITLCEGHQVFVHSKDEWGGENYGDDTTEHITGDIDAVSDRSSEAGSIYRDAADG